MQVEFIAYPGCSTCRKAEKYLKDHKITYHYRHINDETPTSEEITAWLTISHYPILKLLNTSGKVYQALQLKNRIKTMPEEEIITLLSSNGMLMKRPMLIYDKQMLTGFHEDHYDAFFSGLDFV